MAKPLRLADGMEAYNSEEFRAFCARFSIPWLSTTRTMRLIFHLDGFLEVEHWYVGETPAVERERERML